MTIYLVLSYSAVCIISRQWAKACYKSVFAVGASSAQYIDVHNPDHISCSSASTCHNKLKDTVSNHWVARHALIQTLSELELFPLNYLFLSFKCSHPGWQPVGYWSHYSQFRCVPLLQLYVKLHCSPRWSHTGRRSWHWDLSHQSFGALWKQMWWVFTALIAIWSEQMHEILKMMSMSDNTSIHVQTYCEAAKQSQHTNVLKCCVVRASWA